MNIAIDLGTSRTRVFIENKGKVLDEASVVTYDVDTEDIFAVGNEAYEMIGKTPVGIEAVYPLNSGVIAQSSLVENMVYVMLNDLCKAKISNPRVVTAVPCDLTEVERRATVNAVSSFGAKRVYLMESPKAAAIGCGVDVTSAHGAFIADLGSGTADIAVISLGGISNAKTVRHAGKAMDEEIIKYIRQKYSLIIGDNMAEACKKAIGCVRLPEEEQTFRVKGRDALSGLPRFADVTSAEIMEAIGEIALEIVNAVKDVLETTPPELASDIYSDGIILTGGLAKLYGFARLISEKTKLKVRVHKFAEDCVIMGCGKAIKYMSASDKAKKGAVSPIMTAY